MAKDPLLTLFKLCCLGLLEAMEQQQVSIAKAGVVASLPARCSVLAAANPRDGSYNMSKTVAENLNIAKPILSRFDLVFILRDRANTRLDKMVSSSIMNLYRQHGKIPNKSYEHRNVERPDSLGGQDGRMPLSARLAWVTDFQNETLPADLVRDYIAYAREYCKPKLTPEAASVLKDYFMELRYVSSHSWWVPRALCLTASDMSRTLDIPRMVVEAWTRFQSRRANSKRSFDCAKLVPRLVCATLC
jgi:DNA helicase MCM8